MAEEEKPKTNDLMIVTSEGRLLVRIAPDGTLTYGPGYTPEEAAVEFWEMMARKRIDYETRLVFLSRIEELLVRLGKQDLVTEKARLRAQEPEASAHDNFTAERAVGQLEVLVHELIEYGRGLALRELQKTDPIPAIPQVIDKKFVN